MIVRSPAIFLIGVSLFGLLNFYLFEIVPPIDKSFEWAWPPLLYGILAFGVFLLVGSLRLKSRMRDDEEKRKADAEAALVTFGDRTAAIQDSGKFNVGSGRFSGTPAPPRDGYYSPAPPRTEGGSGEGNPSYVVYDEDK